MVAFVATNEEKDPQFLYTKEVIAFLQKNGVTVSDKNLDMHGALHCKDTSFAIILGGDGTMLRHSHQAATQGIPMIGINLGTLGFLTDAEKVDGFAALAKVISGDFRVEKRLMLETCGKLALNDVVLGSVGGLKTFKIYVNDCFWEEIRADGIIVATPTGSTAYSLSAGGPILIPDGQMMVVTPVCPHSLSSRPVVVGADDIVKISAGQNAKIILDGEECGELVANEMITIKKSVHSAKIIKTSPDRFHDILKRKKLT